MRIFGFDIMNEKMGIFEFAIIDERRGVTSYSIGNDFVLTHLPPKAVFPSGNDECHFKIMSPFAYYSLQRVNWCSLAPSLSED
jgi:hypothetical protein